MSLSNDFALVVQELRDHKTVLCALMAVLLSANYLLSKLIGQLSSRHPAIRNPGHHKTGETMLPAWCFAFCSHTLIIQAGITLQLFRRNITILEAEVPDTCEAAKEAWGYQGPPELIWACERDQILQWYNKTMSGVVDVWALVSIDLIQWALFGCVMVVVAYYLGSWYDRTMYKLVGQRLEQRLEMVVEKELLVEVESEDEKA